MVVAIILIAAFAAADPNNLCVTNGGFVATQIVNGLVIGTIYGLMALGLALIFSILGVVSFAHGEFYMIGGMMVYYMIVVWFPGIPPLIGVLGAALLTFIIGFVFERLFLRAINTGQVERPGEYAILVTFGLAFFLQYLVQALVGANPVKVRRFWDFPELALPTPADPWLLKTTLGNITFFNSISIPNPRFTSARSRRIGGRLSSSKVGIRVSMRRSTMPAHSR